MTLPEDPNWRLRGHCANLPDPDAMFPGPNDSIAIHVAKRVCLGCPVEATCLEWADDNNIRDGIWAGLTSAERGRPKKKPAVVVEEKVCDCGTSYRPRQKRQHRCPACSRKANPGAETAPAHVMARADEIAALKRQGLSDGRIARHLGCSQSAVTVARNSLGIGVDGLRNSVEVAA